MQDREEDGDAGMGRLFKSSIAEQLVKNVVVALDEMVT
jgi:hypothetical protein